MIVLAGLHSPQLVTMGFTGETVESPGSPIVLMGLRTSLLLLQGFGVQQSAPTTTRGCVHSMDVARFRADVSDAPVTLLAASDFARSSCTVSDEAC